ncbi:polysaccharide deacetylase family protein [Actinopolymorpha cephalotaxi]|uniref:Peptidoglycan/xylan/chitin deacetylase (PgdA/CDA1 family) n=1 Tax=Actinopolymorpha cephalotaxi TaxID=504797 RepID=A0ABX2S4W1_9ACTN|nr:polysaccharide deacetylase family protein [Actinopolymorpha cephalotaxi]NYH84668.1 peptidoglycan/xylan/chitin deacetylase (PgdA/CDA1 family) [Actinopolymorpha cephalotaxi]
MTGLSGRRAIAGSLTGRAPTIRFRRTATAAGVIVVGLSLVRCAPSAPEDVSSDPRLPSASSVARGTPPSGLPQQTSSPSGAASPGASAGEAASPVPTSSTGTTRPTLPGDSTVGTPDSPSTPGHTVEPGVPGSSGDPGATVGPKVLYLTFDDGPSEWTPKVLQVLARHNAKATFFQLGQQQKEFPGFADQVRKAGNTIGNHTFDHASLPAKSWSGMREEIEGGPASKCLRPPYGAVNSGVRSVSDELNLRVVLWDVDTLDWTRPGSAAIERRVVKGARPGAIVLMHDGGGDRQETVDALDGALSTLAKQGYVFRALDC